MKILNRKYIGLVLVLLIVMTGGCDGINSTKVNNQVVEQKIDEKKFQNILVGDQELSVEVADTPEKITLGLSYRDEIGTDGLLFVMPSKDIPSFWMRGMHFGLDFVWISDDGVGGYEVVDISENVPAPEDPNNLATLEIIQPKEAVTHVLEVPEGWVENSGIEIGNIVRLSVD
jgi:uncharacterized membrane protein (UPF0127 family)